MNDINVLIKKLASYALEKKLIDKDEESYSINLLLDVLDLDEYVEPKEEFKNVNLEETLKEILDFANEKGLLKDNTTVYRDLLDTKIMNCFTPRPSTVIAHFNKLFNSDSKKATDWYYHFSQDTDYIRAYRVKKDLKWSVDSEYGKIEITINLSKPEKDPKAIAAAKLLKQSSYPKCMLCKENEGYRGRVNYPARETIRIIPINLAGDDFYLQYSPYSYYNEHCIVFNKEHVPMAINEKAFRHLISFVEKFPHYILGSNADLPIVGGSILTHDHYQGGNYNFPMFEAQKIINVNFRGYSDVTGAILHWPLSVIKIESKNKESLISLSCKILSCWRNYLDPELMVIANSDNTPHNTITPICRKEGDNFVFYLALRNNLTTKEFPLGLYHPHSQYWNIKKENIGLIEVMGLAILPSRLKNEMKKVKEFVLDSKDLNSDEETKKHAAWFASFKNNYKFTKDNIDDIFSKEIGNTFTHVLEDAGVYKQDNKGIDGFLRFIEEVNKK